MLSQTYAQQKSMALHYMATLLRQRSQPEENFRAVLQIEDIFIYWTGANMDSWITCENPTKDWARLLQAHEQFIQAEWENNQLDRVKNPDVEPLMIPEMGYIEISKVDQCDKDFQTYWGMFCKDYLEPALKFELPEDEAQQDLYCRIVELLESDSPGINSVMFFRPILEEGSNTIENWESVTNTVFDELVPDILADEEDRAKAQAENSQQERGLPSEIVSIDVAPQEDPDVAKQRQIEESRTFAKTANGLVAAYPKTREDAPTEEKPLEAQFREEVEKRKVEEAPAEVEAPAPEKPESFQLPTPLDEAKVAIAEVASEVISGLVLWGGYVLTGFLVAAASGYGVALISSLWFPLGAAAVVVAAKAIARRTNA